MRKTTATGGTARAASLRAPIQIEDPARATYPPRRELQAWQRPTAASDSRRRSLLLAARSVVGHGLTLGGLSLGASATGLDPNMAQLLAAQAHARRDGKQADDFSVILFWDNGGPTHLVSIDMKPNAPTEIRGPFQPIATNVPGLEINER